MNKSNTIVSQIVAGHLRGIRPEHQIDPDKLVSSLSGDRRWRALHEKLHAGSMTSDAFATEIDNRVKPLIFRHRNMKGGRPKKASTKPLKPILSLIVKASKDGRLTVPKEILAVVGAKEGVVVCSRGSKFVYNSVLAKDGRLRISKTARKELLGLADATSYRVSAFRTHITISL